MSILRPIMPIQAGGVFPDCDVLCVFDRCANNLSNELQSWVEEHSGRRLMIFRRSAISFLGQSDLVLDHPRISFLDLYGNASDELVIQQIAWQSIFLNLAFYTERASNGESFSTSPKASVDSGSSSCDRQDEEAAIFSKLFSCHRQATLLACEYQDLGRCITHNIVKNALHLPDAKDAAQLFERFKNIPAIICGAGPSLEKNVSYLRDLKEKAFIFAGGTALNVLHEKGIVPHFSASIDPEPPYERFLRQTTFETPFFYQNRVSSDLLSLTHHHLLHVEGNGNYPLEEWLTEHFRPSYGPFDGGWNVATFLCSLAANLGCNPIVLVGMDLSMDDRYAYAGGIEDFSARSQQIQLETAGEEALFSKNDWLAAAEWLEAFAKERPEKEWINASQGGIGLSGFEPLDLDSAVERFAQPQADLEGWIHCEIMQTPFYACSLTGISKKLEDFDKSLMRCLDSINQFFSDMEASYPSLKGLEGKAALCEVELESEAVYAMLLLPNLRIWNYVFQREIDASSSHAIFNQFLFFKKVIHAVKGFRNE